MRQKIILASCFIFIITFISLPIGAEERWQLSYPGDAKFSSEVAFKQEHLQIKVPSSLKGRSVKNFKSTFKADINSIARYMHEDSDIELSGKSTNLDMEYTKDILDIQIYKSHQTQSGSTSCMDCHGSELPRTLASVGFEHTKAKASPYKLNNATIQLSDVKTTAFRTEVNHWLNTDLMLRAKARLGKFEQGIQELDAQAVTFGLGGYVSHKTTWHADYIISKLENYQRKKTIDAALEHKLYKNLKLMAGGGIFLDGYTQFGTEFAEMGMLINAVVKDKAKLPGLFNTLKNERFGYWNIGLEFEYRF